MQNPTQSAGLIRSCRRSIDSGMLQLLLRQKQVIDMYKTEHRKGDKSKREGKHNNEWTAIKS